MYNDIPATSHHAKQHYTMIPTTLHQIIIHVSPHFTIISTTPHHIIILSTPLKSYPHYHPCCTTLLYHSCHTKHHHHPCCTTPRYTFSLVTPHYIITGHTEISSNGIKSTCGVLQYYIPAWLYGPYVLSRL